jgi:hypothetical protein
LVLLRLTIRSEHVVREAFGSVGAFEIYLNEHSAWMYQQTDAKMWVNGKAVAYPPAMILISGNVKLILSLPLCERGGQNTCHRIIAIKTPNRYDRADALAGEEVKESIVVEETTLDNRPPSPPIRKPTGPPTPAPTPMATAATPVETAPPQPQSVSKEATRQSDPEQENDRQRFIIAPTCPACASALVPERGIYCQACGRQLPRELAVHREVVVSIRVEDYGRLAKFLIQSVNRALGNLIRGRNLQRVVTYMGQRILLIAVQDEMRTSTVAEEERLNELLTETRIGRLTTDPYEIRQAHEMFDSQGSKPVP